jgi:hypothetical protein
MTIYSRTSPPKGFYIYFWVREKDSKIAKAGTVWYVGKGSGNRAWIHGGPKNNTHIIIAEANLSETGAFAMERRYIRWYGRVDNNTGILRNLTDGGEGCSGATFTRTEEQNLHNSIAQKNSPNNYRKNQSGEKNVMATFRGEKHWYYGKGRTEEVCKKMSINHADCSGANNSRARTIIISTPKGEVIESQGTLRKTCKELGLPFATMFKLLQTQRSTLRGPTVGFKIYYSD